MYPADTGQVSVCQVSGVRPRSAPGACMYCPVLDCTVLSPRLYSTVLATSPLTTSPPRHTDSAATLLNT